MIMQRIQPVKRHQARVVMEGDKCAVFPAGEFLFLVITATVTHAGKTAFQWDFRENYAE